MEHPVGHGHDRHRSFFDVQQDDACNIYSEWKSGSDQFLITGYEGIPQNIVINFFCAVGVVIGFAFGRRLLWNYGRIAVIERNLPKWKEEYTPAKANTPEKREYNVHLNIDHQEYMSHDGKIPNAQTSESQGAKYEDDLGDTGLFSWIRITFMLSEDYLHSKCGPDAVLYLRYQRHLIFLSCVICLCSLVVILPIHLLGDQLRDGRFYNPDSFAQSTLANLSSDSPLIWVHTIMAFTYFVISMIVMRHFTRSFQANHKEDEVVHRTVMILGIKRKMCHAEKILAHIKEIYPACVVDECTFAYDTSRLFNLENHKSSDIICVKHLQELFERTMKPRNIRPIPRLAMTFAPWLWISEQMDAIRFYSKEIRSYKKLADYERARTLGRPLGICFLTFNTALTAERMIQEYSPWRRLWDYFVTGWGPFTLDRTPQSRFSRKMRSKNWFLYRAPAVDDIQWENYGLSLMPWYLKAIMVNFTVVLLALFFSTPIILIKTINYYITFRAQEKGIEKPKGGRLSISVLFHELLPTFMIWVAAVTLPSLVSVSDRMIGFWRRTSENRSRMIKTFTFLVTMVIILPSLGLSSILYAVGTTRLKWECIYSPSNAAFYINYVITSCFLGTTSELWRFPELFYIVCQHLWKKSSHENPSIRAATLWEFPIGSQYAWMMLVFAVFIVFSLISPLITPLGVIYMVIKYYVDKHNIYFAWKKCSVDNSVHSTAVNFVVFCMFLLLTITYVFTNIAWTDLTYNHSLQVFASELFIISLFILICGMYADLQGTLGTVVYRKKELKPGRPDTEIGSETRRRRLTKRKLKKESMKKQKNFDIEDYLYKAVPRIPIAPQHRYFAPMLRKDFPFANRFLNKPISSKLEELLDYAELSMQQRPNYHPLVSNGKTAAGHNSGKELPEKKTRLDPKVSSSTGINTVGLQPRPGRSWANVFLFKNFRK